MYSQAVPKPASHTQRKGPSGWFPLHLSQSAPHNGLKGKCPCRSPLPCSVSNISPTLTWRWRWAHAASSLKRAPSQISGISEHRLLKTLKKTYDCSHLQTQRVEGYSTSSCIYHTLWWQKNLIGGHTSASEVYFPKLTNQGDPALICPAQEPFVHKHVFVMFNMAPQTNSTKRMVITSCLQEILSKDPSNYKTQRNTTGCWKKHFLKGTASHYHVF